MAKCQVPSELLTLALFSWPCGVVTTKQRSRIFWASGSSSADVSGPESNEGIRTSIKYPASSFVTRIRATVILKQANTCQLIWPLDGCTHPGREWIRLLGGFSKGFLAEDFSLVRWWGRTGNRSLFHRWRSSREGNKRGPAGWQGNESLRCRPRELCSYS